MREEAARATHTPVRQSGRKDGAPQQRPTDAGEQSVPGAALKSLRDRLIQRQQR
jgi:hypothetical protein